MIYTLSWYEKRDGGEWERKEIQMEANSTMEAMKAVPPELANYPLYYPDKKESEK